MNGFREPFPILYAEDVRASIDFYCANFGFDVAYRWPSEGEVELVFLRLDPVGIGIVSAVAAQSAVPAGGDARFELCPDADDTDATAHELRLNGVEQVVPPTDRPWGERLAYFLDPDGNLIHVTASTQPR